MALGRGLGSLIPQKPTRQKSVDTSHEDVVFTTKKIEHLDGLLQLKIDDIEVNSRQPRKSFNDSKLDGLADSIKEYGIIEPLIVTKKDNGYELIAGERRLRAAKLAGLKIVPAITKEVNEQRKLEIALIENIQREDLNPIETALAYQELVRDFGMKADDIAKKIGKSRPKVANSLRLLSLPGEIQEALMRGEINEGHAVYLMGIDSPVKQMDLFRKITMNKWTVRETNKAARQMGGTKEARVKIDHNDQVKEQKLRDALHTKVEIKRKGKGGELRIDFYSDEELDTLIGKIA